MPSERYKEIKRRRHRRKKLGQFSRRLGKATNSEKQEISRKIRLLSPGAETILENWKLEESVSTDLGNAYVQEHTDFIASIRAGKPLNELKQITESSLTAVLGREAAYTGQSITWDQILNAKQSLMPAKLEWGPMPTPPVAMPGQTTLE